MSAVLAFLALATAAAPASVAQVGEAVQACVAAVRAGAPDRQRLTAAGWSEERADAGVASFARPGNAARVLLPSWPLGDVCLVRASLGTAADAAGVAAEIDGLTGVSASAKTNQSGAWRWRAGNLLVALDPFDDGPGTPPHSVQITTGRFPRETK